MRTDNIRLEQNWNKKKNVQLEHSWVHSSCRSSDFSIVVKEKGQQGKKDEKVELPHEFNQHSVHPTVKRLTRGSDCWYLLIQEIRRKEAFVIYFSLHRIKRVQTVWIRNSFYASTLSASAVSRSGKNPLGARLLFIQLQLSSALHREICDAFTFLATTSCVGVGFDPIAEPRCAWGYILYELFSSSYCSRFSFDVLNV